MRKSRVPVTACKKNPMEPGTLDDLMDEVEKLAIPPQKTSQTALPVTPSKGSGSGMGASGSMMALSGALISASRASALFREKAAV